jgi:hypothetical protein
MVAILHATPTASVTQARSDSPQKGNSTRDANASIINDSPEHATYAKAITH